MISRALLFRGFPHQHGSYMGLANRKGTRRRYGHKLAVVAECLASHAVAVCPSDAADWPLWDAVTTEPVYVRLHGHTRTYASRYSHAFLEQWADRIRRWLAEGRDVHVYFDNDSEGAVLLDALKLIQWIRLS